MNLKDLRKEKGLTQQALADAAGINIRQVQKIEAGEYLIENVTFKTGVGLAEALNEEPKGLLQKLLKTS